MTSTTEIPSAKPSVGRWVVIIIFGGLSIGFLARTLQYGYRWLSGASTADVNYRVMTIAAVIYSVVCGVIAVIAHRGADRGESAEG
jgi:hypothetical protein